MTIQVPVFFYENLPNISIYFEDIEENYGEKILY